MYGLNEQYMKLSKLNKEYLRDGRLDAYADNLRKMAEILCKEGRIKEVTSSRFLHTYKLTASSVQGALKGLLEKDFVTAELGVYSVYDRFFELWLKRL